MDDSGDAAQDASSAAPNNTTPTNLPESHEGQCSKLVGTRRYFIMADSDFRKCNFMHIII